MLFDPPALRSAVGQRRSPPRPPSCPGPAAPVAPPAKGIASIPYSPAGPSSSPPGPRRSPRRPPQSLEKVPAGGDKQVTVKAGDTAGKIAAQNKPASVSLDQMLVALLRSNPDAFIGGNVNRIKSGAVLDIPSAETAGAISAGEATQTIVAQSKDFNSFRRKLAEGVPATQVAGADRQAGGKVQAKVEDRAPASTTPDKLTLSKGAVQGKAATAAEEKIAKERQAKEASTRVAELSKNISDLNKLGGAPQRQQHLQPAAKTPGVAVPAPASRPRPCAGTRRGRSQLPRRPVRRRIGGPRQAAVPATRRPAQQLPAAACRHGTPGMAASATAASTAPLACGFPASACSQCTGGSPCGRSGPPKSRWPSHRPHPEPSLIDELLENPLVLPSPAACCCCWPVSVFTATASAAARPRSTALSWKADCSRILFSAPAAAKELTRMKATPRARPWCIRPVNWTPLATSTR
jgi:pilus assembly protein FimV